MHTSTLSVTHQISPNHHQLQQPMRFFISAFSSDLDPDTEIGLFPTALSPPECILSSESTNCIQELILQQDWTAPNMAPLSQFWHSNLPYVKFTSYVHRVKTRSISCAIQPTEKWNVRIAYTSYILFLVETRNHLSLVNFDSFKKHCWNFRQELQRRVTGTWQGL